MIKKSVFDLFADIDIEFIQAAKLNTKLYGGVLAGDPRKAYEKVAQSVASNKDKAQVMLGIREYFKTKKRVPLQKSDYAEVFSWLDCVMYTLSIGKVQNALSFPVACYHIDHPNYKNYSCSAVNFELCSAFLALSHWVYRLQVDSQLTNWPTPLKKHYANIEKGVVDENVLKLLGMLYDLTWSKTRI